MKLKYTLKYFNYITRILRSSPNSFTLIFLSYSSKAPVNKSSKVWLKSYLSKAFSDTPARNADLLL